MRPVRPAIAEHCSENWGSSNKPDTLCLASSQKSVCDAFLSGRAAGRSFQCRRLNLPWVSMTVVLPCSTLAAGPLWTYGPCAQRL